MMKTLKKSQCKTRSRKRAGAAVAVVSSLFVLGACIAPIKAQQDFKHGAVVSNEERGSWRLASVTVEIPDDMQVSDEPTRRYPDPEKIVWYGDGPGQTKRQVEDLVTTGVKDGAVNALQGQKPVHILVRLRQFHAMTPRARVSNLQLGVHEIMFDIEVRSAEGELIVAESNVNADLDAYSGAKAYEAEARGETQRVRITRRIEEVISSWLNPDNSRRA